MKEDKHSRAAFFKRFRKQHPEPYFEFTDIPASRRLEYEMLNEENYLEIFYLFKDDDNPFIKDAFRNPETLKEYVDYHLHYNRYSPKRGGCDWLFKLRDTGEYIGILHLYDLSRETFNDNHRKCTIGFLTKKEYRNKGYTKEAVQSLIEYVFTRFDMKRILAYTEKNNVVSKLFLQKTGFKEENEKYYYSDKYDYFELWKTPD